MQFYQWRWRSWTMLDQFPDCRWRCVDGGASVDRCASLWVWIWESISYLL